MVLNEHGKIANEYWEAIPKHYPNTQLDEYVIMPNHVHDILIVYEMKKIFFVHHQKL